MGFLDLVSGVGFFQKEISESARLEIVLVIDANLTSLGLDPMGRVRLCHKIKCRDQANDGQSRINGCDKKEC